MPSRSMPRPAARDLPPAERARARRRRAEMMRRRRRTVRLGLVLLLLLLLLWWDPVGLRGDDSASAASARLVEPAGEAPGAAAGAAAGAAGGAAPAKSAGESARKSVGAGASAPASPDRSTRPSAVPHLGSGELVPVGGAVAPVEGEGRVVRYRVEVEDGLPFDPGEFAAQVQDILVDERGWQAVDGIRFERVASGAVPVVVTLASPGTTDELCAPLLTRGKVSCWNGERAVLNALRWAQGAESYGDDLTGYRRYLVNHEVGHGLDHHHVGCPEVGAPAPVMLQQTKGLQGCAPNPWPAVTGG